MSAYTIYNRSTGEIIRSGQCPEKMLGLQVGFGESIKVGEALDDTLYRIDVVTKVAVRLSDEEVAKRNPLAVGQTAKVEKLKQLVEQGVNPGLAQRFLNKHGY